MNKRFLSLGLGLAALFAGSQATQPTATTQAAKVQAVEDATQGIETAKTFSREFASRKPAPAKPANPATKHLEEIAYRPVAGLTPVRFFERPGRRKVKYGKSRWVILG